MIDGSLLISDRFAELVRTRELLWYFVWRDIKVRYKQTMLGALWAMIQPFFTMIVFTLLFGKLANLPSDGVPHPVFYYAALVPWNFFSVGLTQSGNSLVNNSHLITKVYFPRIYLPASAIASSIFDFAIASTLLLGIMAWYDVAFTWKLLLWPVLILPLSILTLGAGALLASMNVFYRDLKYTIPFLVQMLLFLSPVIYSASMIPERYRALAALNPLGGIITSFRACVVPHMEIPWQDLGISMLVTVVILTVGLVGFAKAERYFADII